MALNIKQKLIQFWRQSSSRIQLLTQSIPKGLELLWCALQPVCVHLFCFCFTKWEYFHMCQFFSSLYCFTTGLIVHCNSADPTIFNILFFTSHLLLEYFIFSAELEKFASDPFVCLQLFNICLPVFWHLSGYTGYLCVRESSWQEECIKQNSEKIFHFQDFGPTSLSPVH